MRNKLGYNLCVLLVAIIASLSLSSCDPEEGYPVDPIVGVWESDYTEMGPIPYYDIDRFSFDTFGKGVYEYTGYDGYMYSVYFNWYNINNRYINIIYEDGYSEILYFRFYGRYLELSTSPTFNTYTGYRYVSYY